jgi:hypothetical protein
MIAGAAARAAAGFLARRRRHAKRPRCTCYVLPHADDCGLLIGLTQSGVRVYAVDRRRS